MLVKLPSKFVGAKGTTEVVVVSPSLLVEQEKRRQFLSSLAGGIVIPETLITQEFRKENQTKKIQYIDLENFHAKNKPSKEDIKKLYERNKNIFFIEL